MSKVSQEQVLEKVIEVLRSSSGMLGSSSEEITTDTHLAEDLGLDSLRLVGIMSDLEDHYEIEFSVEDTDARHFHQVSDIVNVTMRAIGAEEA